MGNKELYSYSLMDMNRLYETLMLVRDVFMEFEAPDYSKEGIEEFLRFLEPVDITDKLLEDKIKIWICTFDSKVVGMTAAFENHINLLFVDGKHHRRGIARRLLELVIEDYEPDVLTVNSSPYAVEAYRRLGFEETGSEQEINGIRFTPMKREL